jgi:integrase
MALLFPRPGELRAAEWTEFDLVNKIWTIPATRTKMRREHRTFLAPQSIEVLKELHTVTSHGKLAFPGLKSALKPISENTLNGALRPGNSALISDPDGARPVFRENLSEKSVTR